MAAAVRDGREQDDVDADAAGAAVTARSKSVLGEASGWTVIREMAEPDSSDRVDEEVEEEHDQLVEDEECELREEMEAAEVASIGAPAAPRDESDDERDQVESVAILSGSLATDVIPQDTVPLPREIEEKKDADLDDLSRCFLTRYGLCSLLNVLTNS